MNLFFLSKMALPFNLTSSFLDMSVSRPYPSQVITVTNR